MMENQAMRIMVDHIQDHRQRPASKPMQTVELAGVPRVGEFVVIDDDVVEVVEVQWIPGDGNGYAAMLRVRPA